MSEGTMVDFKAYRHLHLAPDNSNDCLYTFPTGWQSISRWREEAMLWESQCSREDACARLSTVDSGPTDRTTPFELPR